MPWLRMVWRIGKLKVMKSHDGELFVQWGSSHSRKLPRLRWRLGRAH